MGHSVFFRTQGPQGTQAWLLIVCVILCLRHTADALKCGVCTIPMVSDECNEICEATGENSGCMTYDVASGGSWEKTEMTCYNSDNFAKCGTTEVMDDGKAHKFLCCSDEDYCSDRLLAEE